MTPGVLLACNCAMAALCAGDMALVTREGKFHGWLGGACTQPTVVREASLALADGKPRLLSLSSSRMRS